MVTNYEYEDWFYTGSHRKCLLFVEQDADVEIDAGQPPIVSLPSGKIPITITNEDILKERFELQENFNTAENWAFGSVEPSCVSFDIRQTDAIPILKGMTFRLYFYFDDNSSTLLYIGTYIFDTDELSEDSKSRTISGYDMIQAIRDLDIIDFYRDLFAAHEEPDPEDTSQTIWVPTKEKIKVKDARDALFTYLVTEEEFPIVQEDTELPNDNFEFAFDVDTEALSAGQLLEDLCEINGRYGHLSRELFNWDMFQIRNYQKFKYVRVERYDEPGTQIGNEVRIHGMKKGLYETNSIGRLKVYNRDDVLLAKYDDGWKKHFSVYNIYDNILIDNLTKNKTTKSALKTMMKNIYDSIRYRKYVPFEAKAPADLCREAGDRITLYLDIDLQNEDENRSYKTLIFKRRISGIQNMTDTYSAEGDRNLPNFGDYSKSGGYSAKRSGSSSSSGTSKEQKEGTDGDFTLEGMTANDLRLYLKNVGIQTLEEPTNVTAEVGVANNSLQVALKWTDPEDITTNSPYKVSWEGTVVIRKEGSAPKHRWDGVVKVKQSTTRDEFKDDAFIDTDVEPNKVYYYGFYPYFTQLDDDDLKIRHYTWTKIVKVTTDNPIPKPEITDLTLGVPTDWDGSEAIFMWSGNNNKMTVTAKNNTITFKMYNGETVIYTFTAASGTTIADVGNINIGFLQDEELQLAKPSFTYKSGDTYSYNQEDPTEEEMALIYTWLQGITVWDGSEIDILWSGDSNKLTAQISDSHILFKMYTGSTNIYSFNAAVGTGVDDIERINIGFLIDETNQLAKPSFIYNAAGSSYKYNQEEPTDAEMGLIYTWLSAGLPSS